MQQDRDPFFYKQDTLHDFISKPTAPTEMPKKIGPYPIEGLLNQSKISLLYLGSHPETKQPLAIKVLSQGSLAHPELIDHFLKEARIIAIADHPNIVKLSGMERCEGVEGVHEEKIPDRPVVDGGEVIESFFTTKNGIFGVEVTGLVGFAGDV